MNFFYPFLPYYTPHTAQMQYIPVSHQFYLHNIYCAQNFLYQSSQVNEGINYLSTMESLKDATTQRAVAKKKNTVANRDQDQTFSCRIQNKDRNVISNILKAFVNHIYDNTGMRTYIEGLFVELELKNDVSDFYLFFKKHFPIRGSYFRANVVKNMLRDNSLPKEFIKVLKLVLRQFFRVKFPLILLLSTKTKRNSKLNQMNKARELL